ncbi:unnamed protein product [Caenorhabditis brenneri]
MDEESLRPPMRVADKMGNWIDFEDSDEKKHNVVCFVQEKKFYCVKGTLAKHAEYFDKLFFSDTTPEDQREFVLAGPSSPDEFQVFLELIHGLQTLTDENVIGVLELSAFWAARVAKVRCFKYIGSKNCKFSQGDKFKVACQHHSAELLKFILEGINNAAELNAMITPNVFDLPQPLLGMIHQKCRDVPGRWTESPDLIVYAIMPAADPEPGLALNPRERARQARIERMINKLQRKQEEQERGQNWRRNGARREPY